MVIMTVREAFHVRCRCGFGKSFTFSMAVGEEAGWELIDYVRHVSERFGRHQCKVAVDDRVWAWRGGVRTISTRYPGADLPTSGRQVTAWCWRWAGYSLQGALDDLVECVAWS